MAHVIECQGVFVTDDWNKSGTEAKSISRANQKVNKLASAVDSMARRECVFVVRAVADGEGPFFGMPAVRGSAYCARHRPLCVVRSESAEGRTLAQALAAEAEAPEPPPELAHLLPAVLPEPQAEAQPEELRSLLDHPPPSRDTELAE